jgi:hypothetical protein
MAPFLIWTLRRTGGTALTALLTECSGLQAWQDEAFNLDREHGAIARAYELSGNAAALEAALDGVLSQRRVLKHSLETVAWPVSRALLHRSLALGYRHVLLLRLNETQRLLSLLLAELTGAWSAQDAQTRYRELAEGRLTLPPADLAVVRHYVNASAAVLGRMMRALLVAGVDYHPVFYEELFTGAEEQRREQFNALLAHLGLPPRAPDDAAVGHALMELDQRTRRIYHFLPNLTEVAKLIDTES